MLILHHYDLDAFLSLLEGERSTEVFGILFALYTIQVPQVFC